MATARRRPARIWAPPAVGRGMAAATSFSAAPAPLRKSAARPPRQVRIPNPNCVKRPVLSCRPPCGPQGDGCGGVLQCGTCSITGHFCGGGGPSRCGVGTAERPGRRRVREDQDTCARRLRPIANGCGGSSPAHDVSLRASVAAGPVCRAAVVETCRMAAAPCANRRACPANSCGQQSNGCGGLTPNCDTARAGRFAAAGRGQCCGPVRTAELELHRLCLQQFAVTAAAPRASRQVIRSQRRRALPGAVVYVPNGGAAPGYGVQRSRCRVVQTAAAQTSRAIPRHDTPAPSTALSGSITCRSARTSRGRPARPLGRIRRLP